MARIEMGITGGMDFSKLPRMLPVAAASVAMKKAVCPAEPKAPMLIESRPLFSKKIEHSIQMTGLSRSCWRH
jgi:hypothetical protein